MRLIEGSLGGGPGTILLYDSTLRGLVDVGGPVTRVKALLRGFTIGYSDGDHHLKHVTVNLGVGYADDPSQVEVSAHVQLMDSSPTSDGIFIDSELIEVRVDYTLLVD